MTYRLRNIVLAVTLAAVAAVLTSFYVSTYKRSVQEGESDVTVWVAAKDIAPGTSGAEAAKRGVLVKETTDRRNVVPGAISDPAQIEGYVTSNWVYAKEQVSLRRFRPVREQGVRGELKGNMRAVQVAGDGNQLLAGTLQRGDHVDLVTSIKRKESAVSRVVLRDLLVLRAPQGALGAEQVNNVEGFSTQLAVTDAQAPKLFFVVKNGDWTLQLRPVVDAADSPESVETVNTVLGDGLRGVQLRRLRGGR